MLLNGSGSELGELKETNPDAYMDRVAEAAYKSYIFKIRVKQENFNVCIYASLFKFITGAECNIQNIGLQDETRLKATVASVQPINYKMYLEHLLRKIQEFSSVMKIEDNK